MPSGKFYFVQNISLTDMTTIVIEGKLFPSYILQLDKERKSLNKPNKTIKRSCAMIKEAAADAVLKRKTVFVPNQRRFPLIDSLGTG